MVTLKRGFYISALFIALLSFLPGLIFAQDVIAYIGEVGGSVTIIKSNPGEEVEATLGMLLMGGDTVKTGEESYSAIIFQDDGSRVKLGENSQLTLNATRDKKKLKKRMFLGSGGKLWAKITKKKGTDFQIKTPTSVASVKGTRFIMEDREDGVWLYVLEDAVQFGTGEEEVTVGAGQYGRAADGKIETGDIGDGDVPVEPGPHEIIIFFDQQSQGTALQKELRIEYEE
jgi:hypothetical protein